MIYVSEHAKTELLEYLNTLDEITRMPESPLVYPEISAHPDIFMCCLGNETVHANPEELGYRYPENCAFNAACTGTHFIHNLKHTAKRLLKKAENMILVDVPQGYARCNIVIVDENSIITSDRGIYHACRNCLSVLLISESTKEHPYVKLEGFPYGFIGGTAGRIKDTIVFNGKISDHPDYEQIHSFISERNLNIKEFDYPLEDIGSIIYE